jgi:hypothetical protein
VIKNPSLFPSALVVHDRSTLVVRPSPPVTTSSPPATVQGLIQFGVLDPVPWVAPVTAVTDSVVPAHAAPAPNSNSLAVGLPSVSVGPSGPVSVAPVPISNDAASPVRDPADLDGLDALVEDWAWTYWDCQRCLRMGH